MWDGQKEIAPFPCCNRNCRGKYNINELAKTFVGSGKPCLDDYVICRGVMNAGTKFSKRCINSLRVRLTLLEDS